MHGDDLLPTSQSREIALKVPIFRTDVPRSQRRVHRPRISNARSVRNAIDWARLHQANRLVAKGGRISKVDLMTIEAEDILASRVFTENMPDDEQRLDIFQNTSKSNGTNVTV